MEPFCVVCLGVRETEYDLLAQGSFSCRGRYNCSPLTSTQLGHLNAIGRSFSIRPLGVSGIPPLRDLRLVIPTNQKNKAEYVTAIKRNL